MLNRWHTAVALAALLGLGLAPAQGSDVRGLMRQKLMHAQKGLEAVVTSDWVTLETQSRELEALTKDPRWMVLKYPEYSRQSAAFVRAVQELRTAAAHRDLKKAPEAYVAVTLQCVECHRYVARARVAQ